MTSGGTQTAAASFPSPSFSYTSAALIGSLTVRKIVRWAKGGNSIDTSGVPALSKAKNGLISTRLP